MIIWACCVESGIGKNLVSMKTNVEDGRKEEMEKQWLDAVKLNENYWCVRGCYGKYCWIEIWDKDGQPQIVLGNFDDRRFVKRLQQDLFFDTRKSNEKCLVFCYFFL